MSFEAPTLPAEVLTDVVSFVVLDYIYDLLVGSLSPYAKPGQDQGERVDGFEDSTSTNLNPVVSLLRASYQLRHMTMNVISSTLGITVHSEGMGRLDTKPWTIIGAVRQFLKMNSGLHVPKPTEICLITWNYPDIAHFTIMSHFLDVEMWSALRSSYIGDDEDERVDKDDEWAILTLTNPVRRRYDRYLTWFTFAMNYFVKLPLIYQNLVFLRFRNSQLLYDAVMSYILPLGICMKLLHWLNLKDEPQDKDRREILDVISEFLDNVVWDDAEMFKKWGTTTTLDLIFGPTLLMQWRTALEGVASASECDSSYDALTSKANAMREAFDARLARLLM